MTEKITIIGGGYSGVISALLLAQLKNKDGTPLYDITLLEEKKHILMGASHIPCRLHLGGEYPLDEETAMECLLGAILFMQMFGHDVLTDLPSVQYIVAEAAEKEGSISVEKVQQQYAKIQARYAEYFSAFAKEKGKEEVAELLFGYPENIYKPVHHVPENGYTKGFIGGVNAQEKSFNPVLWGAFLEKALNESGVSVHTNVKISEVATTAGGYKLKSKDGREFITDQCVNAAGHNAFPLDTLVSKEALKNKSVNTYLRAMAVLDITGCKVKPDTAFFGLIGEHGGMYSPFNDSSALLYFPGKEGAYIAEAKQDANQPHVPEEWNYIMDKGVVDEKERAQRFLDVMKGRYPILEGAKVSKLVVRPTLSVNQKLEERRHIIVQEVAPNWHQAISTKATFAPRTALEVLQSVQNRSLQKNTIHIDDVALPEKVTPLILPEALSLKGKVKLTQQDFIHYAKVRDIPEYIAFRNGDYTQEIEVILMYDPTNESVSTFLAGTNSHTYRMIKSPSGPAEENVSISFVENANDLIAQLGQERFGESKIAIMRFKAKLPKSRVGDAYQTNEMVEKAFSAKDDTGIFITSPIQIATKAKYYAQNSTQERPSHTALFR